MIDDYLLAGGLRVRRCRTEIPYDQGIDFLIDELNHRPGAYFCSGVEYPGRYSRWDFGFIDPPLEFIGQGRTLTVNALNGHGRHMLQILAPILRDGPETRVIAESAQQLVLEIETTDAVFPEEERSLQPSIFSPLRRLMQAFEGIDDSFLGLFGAFGYDLIFQFLDLDRPERADRRNSEEKALHLFLPDRVFVVDRRKEQAECRAFGFAEGDAAPFVSVEPVMPRQVAALARLPEPAAIGCDIPDADFAAGVEKARAAMAVGEVFEVVLSREFSAATQIPPAELFRRMRRVNPSPYEFLIQLGDEQLVGASPEMFVRVEGDRVESCPIAGTIRRGAGPMEDAEQLRTLYNSRKDEAELTMCTDVDRNDKARICEPGSVRLLDRRLIERYAGLFHTVDHVEGRLRPGLTGIDAFLSHMWAVTLTGAPKPAAVALIDRRESDPRKWYGGAVGALGFDGSVNTGITIRTVHLREGRACYRAGASLVWDSDGQEEADETRTKATAFFRILEPPAPDVAKAVKPASAGRPPPQLVLLDYEDSFVHMLADYFRQAGAAVRTYRWDTPLDGLLARQPDLVVHSPGPGHPDAYGLPARVRELADRNVRQFGVCLGMQAIVAAFGGQLHTMAEPRHGKVWAIQHQGAGFLEGLPNPFDAGAYHSLAAEADVCPPGLEVIARNETGLAMAVRHRRLPLSGVQFHPESILSFSGEAGLTLIRNLLKEVRRQTPALLQSA